MDLQVTIAHTKRDYRNYLQGMHPNWDDSTLSGRVSRAFYLYQKNLVLSFWKCFESDKSMAEARQALLEYLTQDARSNPPPQQDTDEFFNDLKSLKAFLDSKGGVKSYVGPAYDGEKTVYQYAKKSLRWGNFGRGCFS